MSLISSTAAPAASATTAAPREAAPGAISDDWVFGGLRTMVPPLMTGESLTQAVETLNKSYEHMKSSVVVKAIGFDRHAHGTYYSNIVVTATQPGSGITTYIPLALSDSNDDLPTERMQIGTGAGTEHIERFRVASEAIDSVLRNLMVNELAATGNKIIDLPGIVVPRNFKWSEQSAMLALAEMAAAAVIQRFAILTKQATPINLGHYNSATTRLKAELSVTDQAMADEVGKPVHNMFNISLTETANTARSTSPNANAGNAPKIMQVSGFVEFLYAPQQATNAMAAQVPQPPFLGRVVLNNLSSKSIRTPETQILALILATVLSQNNNWVQPVAPRQRKPGSMHSVGSLYRETDVASGGWAAPVDTTSPKFSFGDFMRSLVQPNMIVALDIERNGPQSWILDDFATVADTDPRNTATVQNAYKRLYALCQTVTNGNFAKYFDDKKPFTILSQLQLGGRYKNVAGEDASLAEFSYHTVANIAPSREKLRAWCETFNPQVNLAIQIQRRRALLAEFTNDTAVVTHLVDRVTLNPMVLEALVRGCNDCGFSFTLETVNGTTLDTQRYTDNWAQMAQLSLNNISVGSVNTGFNGQAGMGYNRLY